MEYYQYIIPVLMSVFLSTYLYAIGRYFYKETMKRKEVKRGESITADEFIQKVDFLIKQNRDLSRQVIHLNKTIAHQNKYHTTKPIKAEIVEIERELNPNYDYAL